MRNNWNRIHNLVDRFQLLATVRRHATSPVFASGVFSKCTKTGLLFHLFAEYIRLKVTKGSVFLWSCNSRGRCQPTDSWGGAHATSTSWL